VEENSEKGHYYLPRVGEQEVKDTGKLEKILS